MLIPLILAFNLLSVDTCFLVARPDTDSCRHNIHMDSLWDIRNAIIDVHLGSTDPRLRPVLKRHIKEHVVSWAFLKTVYREKGVNEPIYLFEYFPEAVGNYEAAFLFRSDTTLWLAKWTDSYSEKRKPPREWRVGDPVEPSYDRLNRDTVLTFLRRLDADLLPLESMDLLCEVGTIFDGGHAWVSANYCNRSHSFLAYNTHPGNANSLSDLLKFHSRLKTP